MDNWLLCHFLENIPVSPGSLTKHCYDLIGHHGTRRCCHCHNATYVISGRMPCGFEWSWLSLCVAFSFLPSHPRTCGPVSSFLGDLLDWFEKERSRIGLRRERREEEKKRKRVSFCLFQKREERVGRFRKEKKTKIFFFSFSFLTFLSFYSQCSAAALPFELHVHPCCCCDLLLFFGVRSLPGHEVGCAFIFRFHFHFHSSPGWSSRSSVHWQRLLSLLFSLYFRFHVVFLFFFFWNFHFLKKIRLTFSFSHFISSMFEKCRTHAIC